MVSAANDTFLTIRGPARAELRILGSRFIAQAFPVASRDAMSEALEAVRRTMHDATHHCFAYRLGREAPDARSSDAGEPSGTAGRPLMAALERRELTDILLVVTRYFGGTKLGTGRLARAYGEAASVVLEACERQEYIVHRRLAISLPHPLIGELLHQVARVGGRIAGTTSEAVARYEVEVRLSRQEEFCMALRERTGGAARVVPGGVRAVPGSGA